MRMTGVTEMSRGRRSLSPPGPGALSAVKGTAAAGAVKKAYSNPAAEAGGGKSSYFHQKCNWYTHLIMKAIDEPELKEILEESATGEVAVKQFLTCNYEKMRKILLNVTSDWTKSMQRYDGIPLINGVEAVVDIPSLIEVGGRGYKGNIGFWEERLDIDSWIMGDEDPPVFALTVQDDTLHSICSRGDVVVVDPLFQIPTDPKKILHLQIMVVAIIGDKVIVRKLAYNEDEKCMALESAFHGDTSKTMRDPRESRIVFEARQVAKKASDDGKTVITAGSNHILLNEEGLKVVTVVGNVIRVVSSKKKVEHIHKLTRNSIANSEDSLEDFMGNAIIEVLDRYHKKIFSTQNLTPPQFIKGFIMWFIQSFRKEFKHNEETLSIVTESDMSGREDGACTASDEIRESELATSMEDVEQEYMDTVYDGSAELTPSDILSRKDVVRFQKHQDRRYSNFLGFNEST